MRTQLTSALVAGTLLFAACGPADEGVSTAAGEGDVTVPAAALDEELVPTTAYVPTTAVFEPSTTSISLPDVVSTTVDVATTVSLPPTSAPPSSLAASACNDGPAPDGTTTPAVAIDVDGDGIDETVYTYLSDPVWLLVVEYADGSYSSEAIVDAYAEDNVKVIGAAPFRGTAANDVAFTIGGGAYTTAVGFSRVTNCEIIRMTSSEGGPISFLTGASISNYSGIYCETGLVQQDFFSIAVEGNGNQEPQYEGGFSPYLLDGTVFTEGFGDGAGLSLSELQMLNSFDCFGLSL